MLWKLVRFSLALFSTSLLFSSPVFSGIIIKRVKGLSLLLEILTVGDEVRIITVSYNRKKGLRV